MWRAYIRNTTVVLLLASCVDSSSLAPTADSNANPGSSETEASDAGAQLAAAAATQSALPAAPTTRSAPTSDSDCAAKLCVASAANLADYCDEKHARCPRDLAAARVLACGNSMAQARLQFASSCGGQGVRIQYAYGALDYHYDSTGALTSVMTVVNQVSDACETDVFFYGDSSCRAGAAEPVSCTP